MAERGGFETAQKHPFSMAYVLGVANCWHFFAVKSSDPTSLSTRMKQSSCRIMMSINSSRLYDTGRFRYSTNKTNISLPNIPDDRNVIKSHLLVGNTECH